MSSTKRKARMAYIYEQEPLSSGKLRMRKSRAKQAPPADNSVTLTAEGMQGSGQLKADRQVGMETSDPTQSEQSCPQHDKGVGEEGAESSDDESTSSSVTAVHLDSDPLSDHNDNPELEEDTEFDQGPDTSNFWSHSDESQDEEYDQGTDEAGCGSNTNQNQDSEFGDRLHPNLSITRTEVMLVMLNLFIRHKMTNCALVDILKMINLILGTPSLPENYTKFSDFFNEKGMTREFICAGCGYYLGSVKRQCDNCGISDWKYFLTFDFAADLRKVLLRNWDRIESYRQQVINCGTENVTDMLNAAEYKSRQLINGITLTMNTDGIKVFNSSRMSLWPVLFQINELPPAIRFLRKNIILAGLWLSKSEPDMDIFLKPFTELFSNLYTNGLELGPKVVRTVQIIACAVDTIARCKLQNFKQFNGYYACGYCNHSGDLCGKQIRYGYKEALLKRTHSDTLQAMVISSARNAPVNGVKGISPLIRIPGFDVVRGTPIDYMHCVLLGVSKQLTNIWFNKPSNAACVKGRLDAVDDIISEIKPFAEASRGPRKLTERASWKANEWLNWLIHISPICLHHVLPNYYYKHYMLLVDSITILLKNSISQQDFSSSERKLINFSKQFESLYGLEEMTYNIHLIVHLVDCCRDYGPLWCFSLFPFEDMNGVLKSFIKGPKEPIIQVGNRYLLQTKISNPDHSINSDAINLSLRINQVQNLNTKITDDTITLSDNIVNSYNKNRTFFVVSRFKLSKYIFKPVHESSVQLKHKRRQHNNCYFVTEEGAVGEIVRIISDKDGVYFVYRLLKVVSVENSFWKASSTSSNNLFLIKVNESFGKVIRICINNEDYFCKLKYIIHVD